VMLCTRPPDDASRSRGLDGSKKQPEFKSTVAATCGEQVGWAPPKRVDENRTEIKKCGPSAALRRHVQWIKELQEQVKADRHHIENSHVSEEERRKKLSAAFKKQRDAIRKIKQDAVSDQADVEPEVLEAILKPSQSAKSRSKPMWAMTAGEKDDFEEEQAADLINFAEDLDFDRYIDDLEFRHCLQVVRDRAKKLQKEQDSFKESLVREFEQAAGGDDDADAADDAYSDVASSAGGQSSMRRRKLKCEADGKPEWDASTSCGDERATADSDARSVAESILESNSQLRGVHSKHSVQKLVEKAAAQAQMQRIAEEA